MPRLTIYKNNHENSTIVSNLFIDEYMKDANDAQIKVYLYLLRMMDTRRATSVSDIADKFNHTEKDVMRALTYWEKQKLLDLDYDSDRNLVGIHIRELSADTGGNAGSDPCTPVPPATAVLPESPKPETANASDDGKDTPSPYEKPSYTADQLREFKNRQDTAQLLFIAESYIGKPLTPAEIKTIIYFMDVLHFSEDLIDYLIQYCVDRGKKDFKYIEKVAVSWAEQGITTPAQAQKISSRYDKNVYAIMNGLGKNTSPTDREMEYITRWLKDYQFSTDIIMEACERTVLATDKHRFEYADTILNNWKRHNVQHKSDIFKIDDMYRQRRKATASATAAQRQTANRFHQFTQNQYDFDALEQELLSN